MNLTLRYLLAYMDDILKPKDAAEVGQQLRVNSGAAGLVERIRKVIRQRRLGVPDVLETSSGKDANEVAEYLDNLMPAKRIAEFEQTCLAADEQLAEVAATHQILTTGMSRTVDVPRETHQHLYSIVDEIPVNEGDPELDAIAPSEYKVPSQSNPHDSTAVKNVPAPDAIPPFELPRQKSNWKQVLGVLAVLLLLGGWGYSIVTDPSFKYSPEAYQDEETLVAQNENQAAVDPAVEAPDGGEENAENPDANSEKAANAATAPDTVATSPTVKPEPMPEKPAVPGIDPEPVELPQLAMDALPASPAGEGTPTSVPAEMPAQQAAPVGDESAVAMNSKSATPDNPPAEEPVVVAPVAEPLCAMPEILYESSEPGLIRDSREQGIVALLRQEATVREGDELYCLPYSLASLSINGDEGTLQLRDRTALKILGPTGNSCLGLGIQQGRIVLSHLPGAEGGSLQKVELRFGTKTWYLALPDSETRIGIEVIPQFATGFEQLPEPNLIAASLWVSGAPVQLESGPDQSEEVVGFYSLLSSGNPPEAGQPGLLGQAQPAEVTPVGAPEWLSGAELNLTTALRKDVRDYFKEITASNNLWLDLQGVANHPNARIAEQAAQALALGQRYEALVTILARSPHEESRTAAISGLRAWLPGDPQRIPILKELLAEIFNEETGVIVYDLLWGHNRKDATDPKISRQLVDWLRHEHVAVRELSIYWISELTGQKLGYRPLAPVSTRETAINSWNRHLKRFGALVEAEES